MLTTKIVSHEVNSQLHVLEPTTLGRPLHLLPAFSRLLENELADFIAHELNRRYRANFCLHAIRHGQPEHSDIQWTWYRIEDATLGISIDRPLLLRILDYRYGCRNATTSTSASDEQAPKTETERRLTRILGERIAPRLLYAIQRLVKSFLPNDRAPCLAQALPFASHQPPIAWEICAQIGESDNENTAFVRFALDDVIFDRLLKNLSSHRATIDRPSQHFPGFSERLKVRLCAQLTEKHLTLGEIMDLRVGMILPVNIQERANVNIGCSRVFSALVAENHGKLCLTSFDDTE